MEQLGPALTLVVFAFGMVWYHVLNHPTTNWLRMVGYPLVGIILGEGLWANYLVNGPELLGVHVVVALFTTFVAVSLDIVVQTSGGRFPLRYLQSLPISVSRNRRQDGKVKVSAEAD